MKSASRETGILRTVWSRLFVFVAGILFLDTIAVVLYLAQSPGSPGIVELALATLLADSTVALPLILFLAGTIQRFDQVYVVFHVGQFVMNIEYLILILADIATLAATAIAAYYIYVTNWHLVGPAAAIAIGVNVGIKVVLLLTNYAVIPLLWAIGSRFRRR